MKYIKRFELNTELNTNTGQLLDYNEGEIVVSVVNKTQGYKNYLILKDGCKYKVLRLYSNFEDKFLENPPYKRVDVETIETGEISKGWDSRYFKTEIEFDADKFNI